MVLSEARLRNNLERRLLQRAGGMQGRLIDPNTASVPENYARHEEVWGKDVAFLYPTDQRIRYHKLSGNLFVKSYRKIKGQSCVRWSKPEDLETGLRQADHIREAYDPKVGLEIEKIKKGISLVKTMSQDFQKPNLNEMDTRLIAENAALELTEAGFVAAKKEEKQEIVDKIMKAARLDSHNRVNSSRSRMIPSHAWVDLIYELLVGKVTENKYANIQAKLIREREFERFLLKQTLSHINELTRDTFSFEDRRNIQELKLYVRDYISNFVVRLKPYARIAAISRFLIMNEERVKRPRGAKDMMEEGLEIGELFLRTKTSERKATLEKYYEDKGLVTKS